MDKVFGGNFLRPSRSLRRILVAAVRINFFMQASGNDAVVYYTPEVFKAAGNHRKTQLVGVTVIMGLAEIKPETSWLDFSSFLGQVWEEASAPLGLNRNGHFVKRIGLGLKASSAH